MSKCLIVSSIYTIKSPNFDVELYDYSFFLMLEDHFLPLRMLLVSFFKTKK